MTAQAILGACQNVQTQILLCGISQAYLQSMDAVSTNTRQNRGETAKLGPYSGSNSVTSTTVYPAIYAIAIAAIGQVILHRPRSRCGPGYGSDAELASGYFVGDAFSAYHIGPQIGVLLHPRSMCFSPKEVRHV